MDKLTKFVAEHPGCSVTEISEHLNLDAAETWERLIRVEHRGLILSSRPDGSRWAFFIATAGAAL